MSAPTSALFSHHLCIFGDAFLAQSEQESAPVGKVTSSWNWLPQPIGGSSGSLAPASQIATCPLSRIRFLFRGKSGGPPSTSGRRADRHPRSAPKHVRAARLVRTFQV